jgi:hypothetical protein
MAAEVRIARQEIRQAFALATVGVICAFSLWMGFHYWHFLCVHLASIAYRGRRAGNLSLNALGTTSLGFTLMVASVFLSLWKGWAALAKRNFWEGILWLLSPALALWLVCFVYYFVWLPPEIFSPHEIADFSQHIVVAIGNDQGITIGTGVWVDSTGVVATCVSHKYSSVKIGTLTPGPSCASLSPNSFVCVAGGVLRTPGLRGYYDRETGIAVIVFIHYSVSGSVKLNPTTPNVNLVKEISIVPNLSKSSIAVGDPIFLAGVEDDSQLGNVPVINSQQASVTRLNVDISVRGRDQRIYTSLPFKNSYLGAPILNASEDVVGLVCGADSDGNSIGVPAQYVMDVVNRAKEQMK